MQRNLLKLLSTIAQLYYTYKLVGLKYRFHVCSGIQVYNNEKIAPQSPWKTALTCPCRAWTTLDWVVNIAIIVIGCMYILDHDYLTIGRKEYVVTKNYVLNKHMHLLTRLYGMVNSVSVYMHRLTMYKWYEHLGTWKYHIAGNFGWRKVSFFRPLVSCHE